jgi:hypothetical protein
MDRGGKHASHFVGLVPKGSYNTDMYGKTVNHESSPAGTMTPADLKMLALEENVNKDADWAEYQLPGGTQVMRGFYRPLTHIDDLLKVQ